MNITGIINKTNHLTRLTAVFLLIMLAFSSSTLSARETEDSVFTFRFFLGKNEFYSPGLRNGEELTKMYNCVDRYKSLLTDRKALLYVDGYAASKKTRAENLALARIRSNRVKSELITLKGLKEENFSTRNHPEEGDFVTVRIVVPKEYIEPAPQTPEPEPEPETAIAPEPVVIPEEPEGEPEPAEQPGEPETAAKERRKRPDSPFLLKTNLLDYAILMPNVEVEWKFRPRWSVALEGQMAWYSKTPPHKVYRVATVIPEVRFWPIQRSQWHGMYVGLFVGGAIYDLCNGTKGHRGEGGLGGVSAGYMWPISSRLSLDAGLGVGYLGARDKVYKPFDGHYLYQLTKNINYFGPLRLKLSLTWRIPK